MEGHCTQISTAFVCIQVRRIRQYSEDELHHRKSGDSEEEAAGTRCGSRSLFTIARTNPTSNWHEESRDYHALDSNSLVEGQSFSAGQELGHWNSRLL